MVSPSLHHLLNQKTVIHPTILTLPQSVHTIPPQCKNSNLLFFFNIGKLVLTASSRFGPLPFPTILVGTPGCWGYSLSGSDGYHSNVATPTAEYSEQHHVCLATRPHQCRTLAGSTHPARQVWDNARQQGESTLHVNGVLRLSFPQENVAHLCARQSV